MISKPNWCLFWQIWLCVYGLALFVDAFFSFVFFFLAGTIKILQRQIWHPVKQEPIPFPALRKDHFLYTLLQIHTTQHGIIQVQIAADIKSEAIKSWGVCVREKECACMLGVWWGNGLCPVLTLSSMGDVLGSCGGEREDAWWSPPMQKKSHKHHGYAQRWGRRCFNAISTLPSTFVLRNRCTSEGHCLL